MLTVVVDQITPRIEYVLEFVFESRGVGYEIVTSNSDTLLNQHVLHYTRLEKGSCWIECSSILSEDLIADQVVGQGEFQGVECFTFDSIADPIASIFFHLTRYEEYTSSDRDLHDRFQLSESKLPDAWIEKAMCDHWVVAILNFLNIEKEEQLEVDLLPTFDIDNTYAYKLKSGKRKILSTLRDIAKIDTSRLQERRSVGSGKRDPYDTFDLILYVNKRFSKTRIFWLVASYGKYDRNLSIKVEKHRGLIRTLIAKGAKIGLHPSYGSFNNVDLIRQEKSKLAVVISEKIKSSRQHYLRFSLPHTYRALLKAGFEHDYTMGFAERAGFRAGTARNFVWFDLGRNEKTNLMIHPFVYMDGTLNEYMKLTISESKELIAKLFEEVVEFGGDFSFIWHNETIGDYGKWEGWSEVLNYTLNLKDESK